MTRILSLGLVALALAAPASAQDQAKKTAKVGQPSPDVTRTDLDGKTHKLSDYVKAKKVVVLEWYNPGCPWVKRVHNRGSPVARATKLKKQKVVWLASNSLSSVLMPISSRAWTTYSA